MRFTLYEASVNTPALLNVAPEGEAMLLFDDDNDFNNFPHLQATRKHALHRCRVVNNSTM
jgi:hypothetical protein